MSIHVPGVGDVPVIWMPASDEDFKDTSEGGRSGYQPIAIVHHRIVGSLNSADLTFAKNDADPATVGSLGRAVSAHFGIGYDADLKLYVHQYVDLSHTAYCNGDDSSTGSWDDWYGTGQNHNERTVSIEHDDQGGSSDPAKQGIVREPIIQTSIALDALMLSGDSGAMRAAGIRIRDEATATALGKIVPGPRTLIDHRDIAGSNKPYCWRPWKADKVGFPRARYISELEGYMPIQATNRTSMQATWKSGLPFYDLNGVALGSMANDSATPRIATPEVSIGGRLFRLVVIERSVGPLAGKDQLVAIPASNSLVSYTAMPVPLTQAALDTAKAAGFTAGFSDAKTKAKAASGAAIDAVK